MSQITVNDTSSRWLAVVLIVWAGGASGQATAVRQPAEGSQGDRVSQFALTGGIIRSDNISRASERVQDGTLGQVGIILGYQQQSRRLQADLDANVVYEHFLDITFDDDVLGGFDGRAVFGIVPERIEWFVQNNFGQIATDPFGAATPANRENINYFTTGPNFTLRLGSSTRLQLNGRYSDIRYEISDLDREQYGGGASLLRELSSASALSVNANIERVNIDSTTTFQGDYERREAYLRYQTQGARTIIFLDAGYTELETESEEGASDGLLARFSVSRQISASSVVTIGAGRQFSSAGDAFRDMQDQQGVRLESQAVIATNDPFQSRFASLDWRFSRNRTGLGFNIQYREEAYETAIELDRTLISWGAYASRQLSNVAELRVYGGFVEEDFDAGFKDDDLQAGASLAWRIGRRSELRIQYDRYKRDSTDRTIDFTENRASLFLTWSPLERR
jgi:hypothetical protein